MDGLENIMHSKTGLTKINTMCYHLYIESKIQTKKKGTAKHTHIYRKQTNGYQ